MYLIIYLPPLKQIVSAAAKKNTFSIHFQRDPLVVQLRRLLPVAKIAASHWFFMDLKLRPVQLHLQLWLPIMSPDDRTPGQQTAQLSDAIGLVMLIT